MALATACGFLEDTASLRLVLMELMVGRGNVMVLGTVHCEL